MLNFDIISVVIVNVADMQNAYLSLLWGRGDYDSNDSKTVIYLPFLANNSLWIQWYVQCMIFYHRLMEIIELEIREAY